MRILFILQDASLKGGTERATIAIANGLSDNKNNTVFLLSTNLYQNLDTFSINSSIVKDTFNLNVQEKAKIHTKIIRYFYVLYSLYRYIKKNNIDCLVSVEAMSVVFTYPVVLVLRLTQNVKYIVWEHFNFTVNLGLGIRDFCRKIAAKMANVVVTLTEKDKNMWCNNLRPKATIIAIPNPSPYTISENQYDINSKNAIAIGRLVSQKGFDLLIEIWKFLYDNYPVSENWKLQIIGDGPDYQKLQNKIQQYQLTQKIILVPSTNNIAYYYQNASFLCMTSRFEGLPMTLIEAQSFGLPIISYNCLTGPEEVISKKSGFLIPMNDVKIYAEKLFYLMNSPNKRKEMSDCAKIEVQRYASEAIIKKWDNIL